MSVAASDFSLLSDRALHDNPLVAGKLVLVRLGESWSSYTADSTHGTAHVSAAVSETSHASAGTSGTLQFSKKQSHSGIFWKKYITYLFVMESFLIFALQFILRQKSVKGNVTITILYLKVFHTHTHNLYFTDFTLKLFIVIFCYCPDSLCVSCSCYRYVGRSTARWLAHAQCSQYSKSDLKVY